MSESEKCLDLDISDKLHIHTWHFSTGDVSEVYLPPFGGVGDYRIFRDPEIFVADNRRDTTAVRLKVRLKSNRSYDMTVGSQNWVAHGQNINPYICSSNISSTW